VARNLTLNPHPEHHGIFHMAGGGETSWAGFAEEIFRFSAQSGEVSARVNKISTADYPTLARRPANSRLDCSKLAAVHGVRIADWRDGLARCMASVKQEG
jgi:dTDP-4-dehydrorhamnose reductase